MEILVILTEVVSLGAPIIGIAMYLYFNKLNDKIVKHLFLFMVVSMICDVLSYTLSRMHIPNHLVLNIFFVAQLFIVSGLYVKMLPLHAREIKTIATIFLIFVVMVNGVLLRDFNDMQNFNWAISTFAIMIMAFRHIVHLANHPIPNVERQPSFWISTGIFFYGSLSLVILTVSKYLAINYGVKDFELAWIFHNAGNIFKNLCFAAAIWWSAKGIIPAQQTDNVVG